MTFRSIALALALAGALLLGGCARPGATAHGPEGVPAALSLRALGSLTNYRARLTSGAGGRRMTIRTQVHSAQNWASESGVTVVHLGAQSYVRFGSQWFVHADRPGLYGETNLPAFARQFYAMTRVSGVRVERRGPCRQAGLEGYIWTIHAAPGSSLGQTFNACVADGSGALLRLTVRASSVALAGPYASEVYQITAVGNVPAFRRPTPVTRG
jgi:hypothetical protein